MEDTKTQKAKNHWKHRRSRSTSNLIGAASGITKSDSDDSGKDGNDSDDAQRSFARLSLQSGRPNGGSRSLKIKPLAINSPVVESDSVNDLLSGMSHLKAPQQSSKRRRRYKRMAIDYTDSQEPPHLEVFKEPYLASPAMIRSNTGANAGFFRNESAAAGSQRMSMPNVPVPSTSTGISHLPHRKNPFINFAAFERDSGKRKRSGREKTNDTAPFTIPILSCPSEFHSMIGIGMDLMNIDLENDDELMKSDDDEVSSLSSCPDSIALSGEDDGQEGDDEQSDWVGDEWKDDLGDSERRTLIMRRLHSYVASREIRAGKRRVHPEKPPFSIRTYANEQVSKFLQDPAQSQLRLYPMRREERVQLSHIASLYSLHLQSDEAGGFPILTKTSNTTQVKAANSERVLSKSMPTENVLMESESDSKRIKKSDNLI